MKFRLSNSQIALGIIFPCPTVVSSSRSRLCSQPFRTASLGHILTTFPIDFPNVLPTVFPAMFPTDSRLRSRPISQLRTRPIFRSVPGPFHDPVRQTNCGLPSRPINQMTYRLPVPFPSRGKQTGMFSHTVAWEDPKLFQPAVG